MALSLQTATGNYGHTKSIIDGSLNNDKLALNWVEVNPIISAFRRMIRGMEFDVSEMAISTYLCAKSFNKPITAIPVFPVRGFHHGAISYNVKTGVSQPKDLEGKKVGVRGWTVTTGVWVRGILKDGYGVDIDKITWVLAGDEHGASSRARHLRPHHQPRSSAGHHRHAQTRSGKASLYLTFRAGL